MKSKNTGSWNTVKEEQLHSHCTRSSKQQKRRGPSSFRIHNPETVFTALRLGIGETFLDLGCGPGDYALVASREVGPTGKIIAVDTSQHMLEGIQAEALSLGQKNIATIESDITKELPLQNQSIDCCLLSTVLHSLPLAHAKITLFAEIVRLLKQTGRLAVIECKKEEQPFGPPIQRRISPQELETALRPFGFHQFNYQDLGYTYLVQYRLAS